MKGTWMKFEIVTPTSHSELLLNKQHTHPSLHRTWHSQAVAYVRTDRTRWCLNSVFRRQAVFQRNVAASLGYKFSKENRKKNSNWFFYSFFIYFRSYSICQKTGNIDTNPLAFFWFAQNNSALAIWCLG